MCFVKNDGVWTKLHLPNCIITLALYHEEVSSESFDCGDVAFSAHQLPAKETVKQFLEAKKSFF